MFTVVSRKEGADRLMEGADPCPYAFNALVTYKYTFVCVIYIVYIVYTSVQGINF